MSLPQERSSALPNTPNTARRGYIDAMKGLGIFCVVIGHFIEYNRGTAPAINALFTCIYLFHMALFCTASGLVAKFSLRKLIGQQLWLYLISQAGILAFRVVALKENLAEQGGLWFNLMMPWRHMWYLYALIFWSLTVPLLHLLTRFLKGPGRWLGFAAAVALGLAGGLVEWPFSLGRVFSFYPFFAFGVLFAAPLDQWQKKHHPANWVLVAVAAGIYGSIAWRILTAPEPFYEGARIFQTDSYAVGGYTVGDRALFYLIGFLSTLAICYLAGRSKALASLGRRTLPVYILHMPLYALLVQLGCYEAAGQRGLAAAVTWLVFIIPAVVSLCASAPVNAAVNAVANLWYKTLPGLVRRS